MEYTVHRLGVGSVFRVSFVIYGILGLLLAFLYGLLFLFFSRVGGEAFGPEMGSLMRFGGGLGAVAVFFLGIIFAVFYAAFSAALTAGGAVTYNLLAAWIGGIKVTLNTEGGAWRPGVYGYPQTPSAPPPAYPGMPPVPPAPSPSPYPPSPAGRGSTEEGGPGV